MIVICPVIIGTHCGNIVILTVNRYRCRYRSNRRHTVSVFCKCVVCLIDVSTWLKISGMNIKCKTNIYNLRVFYQIELEFSRNRSGKYNVETRKTQRTLLETICFLTSIPQESRKSFYEQTWFEHRDSWKFYSSITEIGTANELNGKLNLNLINIFHSVQMKNRK